MKIPDWLLEYHSQLVSNLPDIETLRQYTVYHDCGKHLVRYYDDEEKVHYPDHVNASANYWLENGGSEEVGELIRNDMFFHTCKAKDVEESTLTNEQLSTLLLASLAELHANAEMFGGIESTSFKIKYKQVNRRGKKFCERLNDP